ncbi:MAG: hypothetical protein OEM41_03355 [Ignavibacteria bacterium]|nr:hypothetical protein [Ignavibacteria bacterium]
MFFRNKRRQATPETSKKTPGRESRTATFAIRDAERLIAAGEYEKALERLSIAQKLDPDNQYIMAIIDRIGALQAHRSIADLHPGVIQIPGSRAGDGRYLNVTVGTEFDTGVLDTSTVGASGEVQADIRALTMTAEVYLKQGLLNKAFEQLMQAYLLDPVHPAVMACEQHILPSWEKARSGTRKAAP